MKTERAALLFNPSAGKGKASQKKDLLEKLLRRYEVPYDLFVTQSEENLKELVKDNLQRYRTLVGAGGDSTFNIIVNEIIKEKAEVDFGMIGVGSSNDIAKEFNVDSLEKACLALKRKKTRRIDLGCIIQNDSLLRCFLGQANIGLGVWVNQYVEELAQKKPNLGKMQTLTGALGIVNSYYTKRIPIYLTIESDRDRVQGQFLSTIFSNIRYWATGKQVSPHALPDDGKLDCCLINKCSLTRFAHLVFLSKNGKHTRAKEVKILQSQSFEISSEKAFEIQTDGEIIGDSNQPAKFKNIEFKIIPRALNIITGSVP